MTFPLPLSSEIDGLPTVVSLVGPLATGRAIAVDVAEWVRDQPLARCRILPTDLAAALKAFAWLARRDVTALQSVPLPVAEELLALADALRDALESVPVPAHLAVAFALWRGELAVICNRAEVVVPAGRAVAA